jgi:hypothetical protein
MSIELYDAVNNDGLFNVLGKAFQIIVALNTSRGTTIANEVDDASDSWKLDTDSPGSVGKTSAAITTSLEQWQASGDSLTSAVQAFARDYVVSLVNQDADLDDPTLKNCLSELVRQMEAGGYYVTGNTTSVTVTPTVSSTDAYVVATLTRGDGKSHKQPIPETVTLTGDGGNTALSVSSEASVTTLRWNWPQGSGIASPLRLATADGGLLANGGFETVTSGFPSDWVPYTGAVATVWAVTDVEVQTVAISGGPASGFYFLSVTGPDGVARLTTRLAYNATSGAVQAALRALPGLGKLTVTSTGTSPNFTHTITFEGCASDLPLMASVNRLNTGSIAHVQTTAGSGLAYAGRALNLLGDGATNAEILTDFPVVKADTVYCLTWRNKVAAAATGQIRFAVVASPGGSVVNDSAGTANSVTIDVSTLTTNWAVGTLWIRIPPSAAQPLLLSIKATTALQNAKTYCLDEIVLQEATTTYAGGPILAGGAGNIAPQATESWAVVTANDRAGTLLEYLDRTLGLRESQIVMPTSGSTLIPNSVIS